MTAIEIDIPDIRSSFGDSSAVAALYAVAEHFGVELAAGGAFERLLEVSQVRDAHPEEVEAAARDIGLAVKSRRMDAETVRETIGAGRPILCVAKGMQYGVVAGVDENGTLAIHDPARGRLHVPVEAWAGLYHGWGMTLDDPTVKKKYLIAKTWDESKHPRGQPENAGEFGPGGGASSQAMPDRTTDRDRSSPSQAVPDRTTDPDRERPSREEPVSPVVEPPKPVEKPTRPPERLKVDDAVKWMAENWHEAGWKKPIEGNLGGSKGPVMEMDKIRPFSNPNSPGGRQPMPPRFSFALAMSPSAVRAPDGSTLYGGQVFLYQHDGFKYVRLKNPKTKSGAWEIDEAKVRCEALLKVGVDKGKIVPPEADSPLAAMIDRRKDAIEESEADHPEQETLPTGEPIPAGNHLCSRCGGAGLLSQFSHVEGGVCFECEGAGYLKDKETTKSFDESKHPRGGDAKHPGRFSEGRGGGSAEQPTKRPSELPLPEQPTKRPSGDVEHQERREASAAMPASAADKSPLHKTMEKAPARRADHLRGGSGDASRLTLEDGTRVVFKTPAGEAAGAGRSGVPSGTQYRREIATSRVADVLGFGDLVPATTVRNQGGDVGSAQLYVNAHNSLHPDNFNDPFDGPEDAARAAAFDYLVGHLDRHRGNWLVKDGKLVLIDNGLSFPTAYHESDFFNMQFWTNAVKEDLPLPDLSGLKDKWPAVEKELKATGVEDEAIALAKKRFDVLTSSRDLKIADLPSFLDEGDTLRGMVNRYDRPARRARMMNESNQAELEPDESSREEIDQSEIERHERELIEQARMARRRAGRRD